MKNRAKDLQYNIKDGWLQNRYLKDADSEAYKKI